jgi:hypothetical protein
MNKKTGITILWLIIALPVWAQWTDNGSTITTTDKVGVNKSNPGDYWLYVNGNSFINGTLNFPSSTDSGSLISRQLVADRYELILRMRDNTTGDAFKVWFDDYRGSSYDRYPLMVYGNKVLLAGDGGEGGDWHYITIDQTCG